MHRLKVIFFIMIFSLFCVQVAFANSAQLPSLVVILRNAPLGTVVSIKFNGEMTKGRYKQFNGINYYVFQYGSLYNTSLYVDCGTTSFAVDIPLELTTHYERYVTLDFNARSVIAGEHNIRTSVFIALRVITTLIIEGLIFKLVGFKAKQSWYVFIIVNILTQTALNLAILNTIDPFWSYSYLTLAFYEVIIILVEITLFKLFIREKQPIIKYTVVANLLSWHVGGWMLSLLPI